MRNRLLYWAVSAATLMLLPVLFQSGIDIDDWTTAFLASLVIGVVNVVIRPLLMLLTLPLRWLTLGLFTLVVNGVCLYLASYVAPGFEIDEFWPTAVLAAIVYTAITYVAGLFLLRDD